MTRLASIPTSDPAPEPAVRKRADYLFGVAMHDMTVRRDRVLVVLLCVQWAVAIGIALSWSRLAWTGHVHATHLHVVYAVVGGGALTLPCVVLARLRPGATSTRHAIAVAQMLYSALLIHLTGGRIETHFHIFGSLAFLAYYKDWRVIVTATLVVVADHLARGLFWPESVYGITNPEWWRFLEHAVWVVFEDTVLLLGIHAAVREKRIISTERARLESLNTTFERRVDERTEALVESREELRALLETTQAVPWRMWAPSLRFLYVGPQAEALLGLAAPAWCDERFWQTSHVDAAAQRAVATAVAATLADGTPRDVELRVRGRGERWVRMLIARNPEADDVVHGFLFDLSERRRLELDLAQAQKLESVGRLASGVAHEINTPVQFVGDSVHFARESADALLRLVGTYRDVVRSADAVPPEAKDRVADAEKTADVDYVAEHLPRALDRALLGLQRVGTIVAAMKQFAHPDSNEHVPASLNAALDSTLTIARNEYKYVADVETDFGDVPDVVCNVGEINQVFLNLIVNAAHTIGDVVAGTEERGTIRVSTREEDGAVVVRIADTGAGIPEPIRARIFEPFFTTKEVGRGTGQGLAIARGVVVEKHGGKISFETELGRGTTFEVRLPLSRATPAVAA